MATKKRKKRGRLKWMRSVVMRSPVWSAFTERSDDSPTFSVVRHWPPQLPSDRTSMPSVSNANEPQWMAMYIGRHQLARIGMFMTPEQARAMCELWYRAGRHLRYDRS